MAHGHEHGRMSAARGLAMAMALNLAIPLVQIVGGLMAQSMAVVSDAVHNLSDFTALVVAYAAVKLADRPATPSFTYGFRRAEVLAALANVALLFGACLFILFETASRLRSPGHVSGPLVVALALVGIAGNGLSVVFLHRHSENDLGVRGAMLHMLADLFTSVAVLVEGIVLLFVQVPWLDPLMSALIVLVVLKGSWSLLTRAGRILMEAAPPGLDLTEIRNALEALPEIKGVHHLHAWSLGSKQTAFSCHAYVDDRPVSETEPLARAMRALLKQRFNIQHALIEFEHQGCGSDKLLCD